MLCIHFLDDPRITVRYTATSLLVSWQPGTPPPAIQLDAGPVLKGHVAYSVPGPVRAMTLVADARQWLIFCAAPANDNA